MAAQKIFFRSLVPSSFASNSHFIKTFRPRKSSFLSFSKEKSVSQAPCTGPREKIYLHAVIDRLDPGVDFQQHEMPQTNTYTPSLLCHLSLASFFCGYALHSPTMVHAGGSDEENNVCLREFCTLQRLFCLQKTLERYEKPRKGKLEEIHGKTTRN